MYTSFFRLLTTSLLLFILGVGKLSQAAPNPPHLEEENAYLATAYDPADSPVWNHQPSPFDLSAAVALDSPLNITGAERDPNQILYAFMLALEMGHKDALLRLLEIYKPVPSAKFHYITALYQAGLGRLVLKHTEREPALLHDVIIKSIAVKVQSSMKPVTIHEALQLIAGRLNDDKEQQQQPFNFVPFMVGCIEGFEDVVQAYLEDGTIKQYQDLPHFKDDCLSKAIAKGHFGVVGKLIRAFNFEPATLSSMLVRAISMNRLDTVKGLVEAGVDPTVVDNKPFIEACREGYRDIIWYLFGLENVKEHESTPAHLLPYIFRGDRDRDNAEMRKWFLGGPPELVFTPSCLLDEKIAQSRGLQRFFADRDLVALLTRYPDTLKVWRAFGLAAIKGWLPIVKGYLANLDLFDEWFIEKSLKIRFLMSLAGIGQRETALELLLHPRRSRRDRYRLQFRLLQRYSADVYVTNDFLRYICSFKQLLYSHLLYYLPAKTLHRLFWNAAEWSSDPFLQEVERSDKNSNEFYANNAMELVSMVTFFDKSAGLFGEVEIPGGIFWNDLYHIRMVEDMERRRRLPDSREYRKFKEHLRQVADTFSAIGPEPAVGTRVGVLAAKPLLSQLSNHAAEKLKYLPVGESYMFAIGSSGHTGYALATKADAAHLNIKVFNSYHQIVDDDN
jgi:hypothetical protein